MDNRLYITFLTSYKEVKRQQGNVYKKKIQDDTAKSDILIYIIIYVHWY